MPTAYTGLDPAAELRPVRGAWASTGPRSVPALCSGPALELARLPALRRATYGCREQRSHLRALPALPAALRSRVRAVWVRLSARSIDPRVQVPGHSLLWARVRESAGGSCLHTPGTHA